MTSKNESLQANGLGECSEPAGDSGTDSQPKPQYLHQTATESGQNQLAMDQSDKPELIAYRVNTYAEMKLVPAGPQRNWMTATRGFAQRCLPMLLANQAGWFILNSHSVRVTWNGREDLSGIRVEYLNGSSPYPVSSHFGFGIVTWTIPYLFRTCPGFNLLVRGPANWPKDGAYPLEGLVETDWSTATFTMNWRLTRSNWPVTFAMGEPFCMLVPQKRFEIESVQPKLRDITDDRELAVSYTNWTESRRGFLLDLRRRGSEAAKEGWQRHYFRGETPDRLLAPNHQTKLHLKPFEKEGGRFNKSLEKKDGLLDP